MQLFSVQSQNLTRYKEIVRYTRQNFPSSLWFYNLYSFNSVNYNGVLKNFILYKKIKLVNVQNFLYMTQTWTFRPSLRIHEKKCVAYMKLKRLAVKLSDISEKAP